jgi:hypothetical protein
MTFWNRFFGALLFVVLHCAMAVAEDAATETGTWKPLFNGKDLSGFYVHLQGKERGEDPDKIFQVHDGMIHVYKDNPVGTAMPFGGIVTEKDYSHYRLRLQYKWGNKQFPPRAVGKRDAGILYHVVATDGMWPTSVEYQIQEGDTGDFFMVYTRCEVTFNPDQPDQFLPAADGGVPKVIGGAGQVVRFIKRGDYELADDWNTAEVVVRGDEAIHILNGKVNNRCTKMQIRDPESKEEWVPLTKGRILLQCEWAELFYRNIEIMELDPNAADEQQ